MNSKWAAERHPQHSSEGVTDLSIFRRAYGERLQILCGRLSVENWPQRPKDMEVYTPSQKDPRFNRVELVRAKEVVNARSSIDPEQLVSRKVQRQLREAVPSLNESITDATIRLLRPHQDAYGGHFFDLIIDDEHAADLGAERNRVWQTLEAIADVPVGSSDWKRYNPNINFAYLPPGTVEDQTVNTLVKVISAAVRGMPIQLGAAQLPDIH